jgi:hypothetical protein
MLIFNSSYIDAMFCNQQVVGSNPSACEKAPRAPRLPSESIRMRSPGLQAPGLD